MTLEQQLDNIKQLTAQLDTARAQLAQQLDHAKALLDECQLLGVGLDEFTSSETAIKKWCKSVIDYGFSDYDSDEADKIKTLIADVKAHSKEIAYLCSDYTV